MRDRPVVDADHTRSTTTPGAPALMLTGGDLVSGGSPGRMLALRSRMTAAAVTAVSRVTGWAGAHGKLVTGAGTLVTVGGLAVVLAGRWGRLADAAVGASGWLLGAAVVLHIGSLVARSEAWNLSVRAAGGTVARRRLYRAASVGYVGNIINGELGFALRIASLRRSAPAEVPKVATLAATEVPLIIVEVTLATLTSFTLVGPLGLAWWAPPPRSSSSVRRAWRGSAPPASCSPPPARPARWPMPPGPMPTAAGANHRVSP
jgi:hypothetical protein